MCGGGGGVTLHMQSPGSNWGANVFTKRWENPTTRVDWVYCFTDYHQLCFLLTNQTTPPKLTIEWQGIGEVWVDVGYKKNLENKKAQTLSNLLADIWVILLLRSVISVIHANKEDFLQRPVGQLTFVLPKSEGASVKCSTLNCDYCLTFQVD